MQHNTFSETELTKLQNTVAVWKQKATNIQTKFDFDLPDYIIDEIIINTEKQNYLNLHYLINCAVVNNRISEYNGTLLKRVYNFKK